MNRTIELQSSAGPITVNVGRLAWVFATPESNERWMTLISDEQQELRVQIWKEGNR